MNWVRVERKEEENGKYKRGLKKEALLWLYFDVGCSALSFVFISYVWHYQPFLPLKTMFSPLLTESRRRRDMFLFQIMHNSLLPLSSYHHCNHNHHDHTTHPRVLQSADRKPLSKHGYRNTVEQKSIWHLQILHLVSLKKMVEGFYLHHRNTSTVRDMLKKYQRSPIVGFLQNLFV